MAKIKILTPHTRNIYKLQKHINTFSDNLLLKVMFNSVINSYPDKNWMMIEDDFFSNLPSTSLDDIMIYTILSYKLTNKFRNIPIFFQKELIYALIVNNISYYKLCNYAQLLLEDDINSLIMYAYNNHYIKPHNIYKVIFSSKTLDKKEIISIINKFIREHEMKLFNGNYNFFNIYTCLKKLINLDFLDEDISILELIPLFETIENDEVKLRIKNSFKNIELNDKPLFDKLRDSLTVTLHYAYELPTINSRVLNKKD